MLPLISGLVAAGLFAVAGWLGVLLAETLYGSLTREDDGPASVTIPTWVFVAVTGCMGFFVGMHGVQPVHMAVLLVAVLALTTCAATDFRAGLIPDLFSIGPLVLVLGIALVQRDWAPLFGALFVFVPFAAMAAISKGRGMGWGDVKLATLGGALLGAAGITLAITVAALTAYVVARVTAHAKQPIAFGPYLAASIGAALAVGSTL